MNYKEVKSKRKKRKNYIFPIILLIITMFSVTFSIFLVFFYINKKNQFEEVITQIEVIKNVEETEEILITQEDIDNFVENTRKELLDDIKSMVENGDGMLTILQKLYPDYVIASSDGNYHFFPILETMEKNNFDLEKFTYPIYNEETKKWDGTANYMAGTEKEAKKGIDVSTYQGTVNWEKVKKFGIDFAIIRLGYRGYETGKIVLDKKYFDNIEASIKAGLDTGVYFFTEALNEEEAMEEADFVIDNLKDYKINMPVVIDVEESANKEKTRTKNLTADQRTKNVIAFCKRIKEAGYDVMIYGNLKSFMIMMNIEELEEYDKWFAYYRYPFHFPYKIKMWQYTAYEKVDGIDGEVDVNIMFY